MTIIMIKNQKTNWEDCCVNFVCKCGNEMILDSQSEPETCTCGKVYSLLSYVVQHIELDVDGHIEDEYRCPTCGSIGEVRL